MDVELLTLAGAAAEALVQAVVSDGWTGVGPGSPGSWAAAIRRG